MDMKKIVLHVDWGCFMLSEEAKTLHGERGGMRGDDGEIRRDDPIIIKIVEDIGRAAGSNLAIVEIPEHEPWYIVDSDGWETLCGEKADLEKYTPPEIRQHTAGWVDVPFISAKG